MYEDLIKDMKSTMQPMMDVAEINRKTLERIASAQAQCVSGFVAAGVNQAKALTATRDPQAIATLQFELLRTFDEKLTESAEANLAAINEARDAIKQLITSNYARLAETAPFAQLQVSAAAVIPAPVEKKAEKKAPVQTPAKRSAPKAAAPAPQAKAAPAPQAKSAVKPIAEVKKPAAKVAVKAEAPKAKAPAPKAATRATTPIATVKKPAAKVEAKPEAPKAAPAPAAVEKAAPEAKATPTVAKAATAKTTKPRAAAKKAAPKTAAKKPSATPKG